MSKRSHVVTELVAASLVSAGFGQDCAPVWSMTPYRLTNNVGALLVYDDGNGPGLLIGDGRGISFLRDNIVTVQRQTSFIVYRFRQVPVNGGVETYAFGTSGIYRLNGGNWDTVSLGSAGGGDVAVYDDGTGPALYFASFTRVYKMVGATPVQIGLFSTLCGAATLAVWDDGAGERLFVGGYFSAVSGVAANGVAAWNGEQWSPLGEGVAGNNPGCNGGGVLTLCVFDDGTGEKLYAGGEFDHAGGVPVENVARWDGVSWHSVGTGMAETGSRVTRLIPMTRGGADELWACGAFHSIGGIPASGLAMWDGTAWQVPIQGIRVSGTGFGVTDVVRFPDASGQTPFFVGGFGLQTTSGIEAYAGVLRFGCVCADASGDGLVNLEDLAIVLANFGSTRVEWNFPGNIDQDPNVDLADLTLVLSQFGETCE